MHRFDELAAMIQTKSIPLTFILISCRFFKNDWRVPLFESLHEYGFNYYHLRLGRTCILTNPQITDSQAFPLTEFATLLQELHGRTVDHVPVYFVSTATAVPSLVLSLRLFLRDGIWLFDAYDDYSLYWGPWITRLKGHIINWLFYRITTATLIAPPNLRKKFPKAYNFEVASNVLPIDYDHDDLRNAIVTSNLDGRLDYDFLRDVASKQQGYEIHIYGRLNNHARDWPRLRELLNNAKNIKYHGQFEESRLRHLLSQYRIALAPFKTNVPFTRSTDPARFYDYLNAGLEIISTDIPRARDRSEFVHIANDADEAARLWRKLESNPNLGKSKRWHAVEHSWGHRAQQLRQILGQLQWRRTVDG